MNAPIRMRLPRPMLAALVPDGLTVEQAWVVLVGEREHLHTTPDGQPVYGDIIAWDPLPASPLPDQHEAEAAAERLAEANLDGPPVQWHWYHTTGGGRVLELWGLLDGHEVWPEVAIAPLTALLANEPAPAPDTTADQAKTTPEQPVPTPGARYRDRDGDIWTVAEKHGQVGLKFGGRWGTWAGAARDYGPLTPITPAPAEPAEPRVMLGDLWEDGDGDIWQVVTNSVGEPRLTLGRGGSLYTWAEANADYEPLTLVQRAGWRRATNTVTAAQLRAGRVVSCEAWENGAPVRLLTVAGGVRSEIEVTYQALGSDDGDIGTGTAARDARITLWDEIAGGAR